LLLGRIAIWQYLSKLQMGLYFDPVTLLGIYPSDILAHMRNISEDIFKYISKDKYFQRYL